MQTVNSPWLQIVLELEYFEIAILSNQYSYPHIHVESRRKVAQKVDYHKRMCECVQ